MLFKEYLVNTIIGRKLRFTCDCSFPMDVMGTVKSYKSVGEDVVIYLERDGDKRTVSITLNHPGMKVEEV